jgi:ABC-type Fe3+-hydroxamate transport system substrate-binding protein
MFIIKIENLQPKRIVSLVPSITELLHYLSLENEVVGITKFCIHPKEWFHKKTRIGGTKDIDVDKIVLLQPDLIICSKEENIQSQVEEIAKKIPVYVTDVKSYEDALQMIENIGILCDKEDLTIKLLKEIRVNFKEKNTQTQNAIYLIWKDPYMTIGGDTYIDSMMRKAGFKNMYHNTKRYPIVTVEEMKVLNPSLILLSSEPYPFKEKHIIDLKIHLPNTKIILVDGEMFSWYGSKMKEAVSYFAQLNIDINNL